MEYLCKLDSHGKTEMPTPNRDGPEKSFLKLNLPYIFFKKFYLIAALGVE